MFSGFKIGIIGLGYVGSAVHNAFSNFFVEGPIIIDPAKGYVASYDDLKNTDAVFVCVPTPRDDENGCDTSILEKVLLQLSNIEYSGVIISKCTATPDIYKRLGKLYPNLVHIPEFLTAANAISDYFNEEFSIVGGSVKAYMNEAERIIRIGQTNLKTVVHCTIEEAALTKYTINGFLAVKVVFMNEIQRIAATSGIDYNKVVSMVQLDYRIGDSHMKVPGPDGEFGFGGHCLPKDTLALLKYAEQQGAQLNVLDAAVKKNLILRLTEPK